MVTQVIMPKFGLSMETGVIGSWLVEEGAQVTKASALCEVTTDKISNTCEAPASGVLRKILLAQGEEAPCGEVIALIADSMQEDISGECTAGADAAPDTQASPAAPDAQPCEKIACCAKDVLITPRAKKVAEERGLAYAHIKGTGIGGAITISDLKQHGTPKETVSAASASVPVPVQAAAPVSVSGSSAPTLSAYDPYPPVGDDVVVMMSSMETTVAKAMHKSLMASAQTTIATEAEVSNLVQVYRQLKGKYAKAGIKLSYTAMIIKAVAMALENHPTLRSTMVDETHIKIRSCIDIGVAVDVPKGLLVPVIRQANLKDLRTICMELVQLTDKAKNGGLVAEDMGNACMTITNLGMFGITYFTPVLNTPESAILGVGALLEKMMVKDGGFYPGHAMNFSLTHDHRIVNGAPAARFLKETLDSLQDFRWI